MNEAEELNKFYQYVLTEELNSMQFIDKKKQASMYWVELWSLIQPLRFRLCSVDSA